MPNTFSSLVLPPLRQGTLACIGVLFGGDPAGWIEAVQPFVTTAERARARRFLHALDAARHLLGRALVRRMLGAATGIEHPGDFPQTAHGKPVCPAGSLAAAQGVDFSISHSGGMVWAAFCRGAALGVHVGIDVEQVRPLADLPELASQLHPLECAAILAQPEPERTAAFYRCWTRKEAVLKALGRGLALPLHSFQVRPEPSGADWLESLPQGEAQEAALFGPPAGTGAAVWTTHSINVGPGYQCSVAASAPGMPLVVSPGGNAGGGKESVSPDEEASR